ncbi:hypothetical protein [Flagellimonas okinawensis]|uniref:Uncharacterized protein n=1 Tax=Flagellimonas okinawensis TaxID=3031324 RepID=A0ABT5XT42_9FLAO|nr:hypothetical protein [[Muricauda] okinawensis]MDF0709064.1 hypothetical protein [[Muricauda] okinawensis]
MAFHAAIGCSVDATIKVPEAKQVDTGGTVTLKKGKTIQVNPIGSDTDHPKQHIDSEKK